MAEDSIVMTDRLRAELAGITSTQRAAVLMLLLGEEQAAEIIKYLSPKEVQALGAAMVQVANFSQEAVNFVLDEFVDHLKNQNNVSIGGADYVEKVMRLALGDDKAASVLGHVIGIVIVRESQNLSIDACAARLGMLVLLHDKRSGPLPHDKAITVQIERSARDRGIRLAHGPDIGEGPVGERTKRCLGGTCDHHIRDPFADVAECFTESHGAAGTAVGVRGADSLETAGDGDIGMR